MAKYRLTAKIDFAGSKIKKGETITVEVPHYSWITTQIVRDALEAQTNTTMYCGYSANEWIIEKL